MIGRWLAHFRVPRQRSDDGKPGRYQGAVDLFVAGLVVAVSAVSLSGRSTVTGVTPGALDWVATGVLALPLICRRRAPVVVFWTVAVLVALSGVAGADTAAQLFVPLVAVYTIARHGARRQLWPAVTGVALSLLVGLLVDDVTWASLVALAALAAATVLLGLNLRTRQAYLAELEERARRLERERDQRAQLAVAEERARIAREMHDVVAHHLAVMVTLADGAAVTPHRAGEAMTLVSSTGRQALAEMRRLVGLLRAGETGRAPQPGLDDLDRLVEQVRAAGVSVALTREGVPGQWGPGAELAVYRIVQEALTNTLKHAGPHATACVLLTYTSEGVELEVVDDGAGRAARTPAADGRHGLAGMLERAASYGGHVDAGPLSGAGWRVRARLCFTGAAP
jgi:signal transduction histidine kinase